MSLLVRFEKQLEQRGLSVVYHGEGKFTLKGPDNEKTPEVMASCKAMKKVLLQKYDPKFLPEQANNPANTVHPQKPPVTSCESSTPAAMNLVKTDSPTTTTHSLTTCSVCLAEVNEAEMKALPKGMWMEMCGRSMGQRGGEPCCPYHPKSLWSNPPETK